MKPEYEQTGYLHENFKIFHIRDQKSIDIPFHYHDFHKILICLDGNLSYCVEGRTYQLCKNDIVFIPAGEVHRPIIAGDHIYDRIIVYISKDYLNSYQGEDYHLGYCLKQAHEKQSHVLHIPALGSGKIHGIMKELEESFEADEYANEFYRNILFLEFMIHLNRAAIHNDILYLTDSSSNEKVVEIIDYLNQHLTEEISIDSLASRFFISRYYLMHTFKEETGYTIGNYLSTKRLLLAKELITSGMNITEACFTCGFHNYSTFSRAYKKAFGVSPGNTSLL